MKGKFESNRRESEKKMGNCVMVITSGLFKIISSGAHSTKWLIEKSFFGEINKFFISRAFVK